MSDLEAQSPTPPLHAEDLEDEIANIIDWAKEEEIGSGELAEHILQAVADALLAGLPKKLEYGPDEAGDWIAEGYNMALDAVTRVIGELGGRDD